MKTRLFLLGFVFLCLALSIVSASDIDVTDSAIEDTITPSQTASFKLRITNNQGSSDSFEIQYFDIDWRLDVESPITIPGKSTKEVTVELSPIGKKAGNVYGVPIMVISNSDNNIREEHLLRIQVIDYGDLVDISFDNLPSSFDPRMSNVIKIKVENSHGIDMEGINVNVKSELFDETQEVDLDSMESKVLDFIIKLDEDTREGDYDLTVSAYSGNNLIIELKEILNVGTITDVKEGVDEENGFLINRMITRKTNNGNSIAYEQVTKKLNWFEKLFTSATPNPNKIEKSNGNYLLIWNLKLEPGESKTVTATTSYRGFAIFIIIIIVILYALYYFLRKEVKIHKKVVTIRHEKDGTSTMRIVLVIHNKSGKIIKNVKVMDRLYNISEVPKEFGTLKPSSVNKGMNGANLIWNIPLLGKREEVVISYKAKSKMHPVGKFFIPVALVRYKVGSRSKVVSSNRLTLFS